MVPFEARHRRGQDPGDDFRDFVCEALSVRGEFGSPVRRDSGSSDGCIDLFGESEGAVVECKHIVSGAVPGRKRVDQEWKETRDKLDYALLSLGGIAAPTRAPYRPWADSARPIRQYVFATSTNLANLNHRSELLAAIESFFRAEIGSRAGYEHLRNIQIHILDWSDLEKRLNAREFKPLVFRWLEQWPAGFSGLEAQPETGFRSFLGDRIPYLARDTWTPQAGLAHTWTERDLIERLIKGSNARTHIMLLTGPGGVGKTRLGLELARRIASEHKWWAVRCDGLNANSDGLRKLLEQSSQDQRIVLFADYLEIWSGFEAFVNDIVSLNETSGHAIRLIGTCRASYRERLPPSIPQVAVGAATPLEEGYSRAVCEHILRSIDPAEVAELASKCRYNAALAAFLVLLHDEAPNSFAAEVSSLRACPDFGEWVVRRLHTTGLDLEPAASILASCPLSVDDFADLAGATGDKSGLSAKVLVADHWIERQEPSPGTSAPPFWATFHDVFADSVLSSYLKNAPDLNDSIDRLLEHGALYGSLRQILTSLERLKEHPAVGGVNWLSRLIEVERRKPEVLAAHPRTVLSNALFSPTDRLTLIANYQSLRTAIVQNRKCDVALAITADALAKAPLDESSARQFESKLLPLVDTAVTANEARGNLVLKLAFATLPERYRHKVLTWCASYPAAFQTHYLLKVWLDDVLIKFAREDSSGLTHIEAIKGAVDTWLRANRLRWHATFVLSPWLEAAAAVGGERGAEMAAVARPYVESWLGCEGHSQHLDSQFIYTAWLRTAAAAKNDHAFEMAQVVQPHLQAWLTVANHPTCEQARFIYRAWLRVATVVTSNQAREIAAAVQPSLKSWLAVVNHATDEETRWIYISWLNIAATLRGETATRMLEIIAPHLSDWITVNGAQKDAQSVYWNWLEAARGPTQRRFLRQTLASILAHQDEEDSDYLLETWLDQGFEFAPIRSACFAAVHRMRHRPEGTFLLKHVVRQRDLPDEVIHDIVEWCIVHAAHPDAINRIGPLLTWRISTIVGMPRLIRGAARILHLADLKVITVDTTKVAATRGSLGSLFGLGKSYPRAARVASICLVAALRDGRLFDMRAENRLGPRGLLFDQKFALAAGLVRAVNAGKFSLVPDCADYIALARFCEWVGQWRRTEEEIGQLRALAQELTSRFGQSSLWLRMLGSRA